MRVLLRHLAAERGYGPGAAARADLLAVTMARARKRWTGTTTERGYGRAHQAERERRLAAYRPGDPCAHCGHPMTAWPLTLARQLLDLPHNDGRTGYLPGLAHRACNRADGARRGNRTRARARTLASARPW